ncbi:DNA primase [Sphingomonas koreensis]|nr:DNA primase [Sphingomonas koreensis]
MAGVASDLSRQLARHAEAVCRHYLAAGHREGRYWIVGDVHGSKGRSLYVRLKGGEHGKGAAGKWTDAATGEHGDLLDLIGLNCGHHLLPDTLEEVRRFLAVPRERPDFDPDEPSAPAGSRKAAQRLFAASRPIAGTLAEHYLRARGIVGMRAARWLRFHPRCWYRPSADDLAGTPNALPALIAAVTDDDGMITGCHRTWLAPDGSGKAAIATPRRAMGDLLGSGVRFGRATSVMLVGEGLETVLSVRMAAPALPMIATLSAAHLAAVRIPQTLRRLYVARDRDPAGSHAFNKLRDRTEGAGIEMIDLEPGADDFNSDLQQLGLDRFRETLAATLRADDLVRMAALE